MAADDDLIAMLRAAPHLTVYDGDVDVDEEEKDILVPLPYIVYVSTPGYDRDERLGGQVGGRVLEFDLMGVGEDRNQTKDVLNRAREAVSRKYLNGNLIFRNDDNFRVRREDTYTRPGNEPIFYGVDRYSVAI